MKKQISYAVLALLLFAVFAAVSLQSANTGQRMPDYSAFLTGENGTSLLYDCLRRLDYPVSISYGPIESNLSTRDIYVCIEPDPTIIQEQLEGLLEWVARGGRLIFLQSTGQTVVDYYLLGQPYHQDKGFRLYEIGYGAIVTGNSDMVTNRALMTRPETGDTIQAILTKWGYTQIYFAEYYHGFMQEASTWQTLPSGVKVMMIQVVLFSAVLVLMLGKRFGKALPYHAEDERAEHEYHYALANLYARAGIGEIIQDAYLAHLADVAPSELSRYWHDMKMPRPDLLAEALAICQSGAFCRKKRKDRKQMMRFVSIMRELENNVAEGEIKWV